MTDAPDGLEAPRLFRVVAEVRPEPVPRSCPPSAPSLALRAPAERGREPEVTARPCGREQAALEDEAGEKLVPKTNVRSS